MASKRAAAPRVVPSSDGEESSDDSGDLADPVEFIRSGPSDRGPFCGFHHPKTKPKKLSYTPKFSLANILAEKRKAEIYEEGVVRANNLRDKYEKGRSTPASHGAELDETLGGALGEDNAAKIRKAMDRGGLCGTDKVWYLFGMTGKNIRTPVPYFDNDGPFVGFRGTLTRQLLFQSGYVQDIVHMGQTLPEEMLMWILEEFCLETREDLMYAYARLLEALPESGVKLLLTPARMIHAFTLLGGRKEDVDISRKVEMASGWAKDPNKNRLWNLKLFIRTIGSLSPRLDGTSLQVACGLLMRTAIDTSVFRNPEVLQGIEQALEQLFSVVNDVEWTEQSRSIGRNLLQTIAEPQFCQRVLDVLPVHLPQFHLFRRRLALAFLFNDISYFTMHFQGLVRIDYLSSMLNAPLFELQHEDFLDLTALVKMVDIAIDNGAPRGEKAAVDVKVDELVHALKVLFSSMNDMGARSLDMTVVKNTIEWLQLRLNYSVRSRQKLSATANEEQTTLPEMWKVPIHVKPST